MNGRFRSEDFSAAQAAPSEKEREVTWSDLRMEKGKENEPSERIRALDGALVRLAGFMIPLEDNARSTSEFLLVPTPMACIHVPAPPPSQIVHVTMTQGRALKAEFGPLILRGRLRLEEAKGFYGSATYSMLGLSSEPYFK
ncbi:MAG: DUF3299 domain-containing protein [Silvanigrellales bacterium]|jgi:hypothetical protein|nr:DUF3299 domain-containing protein [Silvanigrellales bacterium]